jgi:hypothetical protein
MKRITLFVLFSLFIFNGCGKPQAQQPAGPQEKVVETKAPEAKTAGAFQPFIVYKNKGARENHFVPSGFMPDGKCLVLDDAALEDCYEGKTCIKVVYDVACSLSGQKWAGLYWLNPANNWGSRKGGFNLTGAKELTFWAKGKKGGERIEEFKIGGITGDYPDSDMAVIGPVVLTNAWKKYSIDLRGKDLSYISGGFAWSTSVDVNPGECTFYLDNIQYE